MAYASKEYTGTYQVVKLFRKSGRREIIQKNLTREEAKRVVNRYPDSNRHMVIFEKQYHSDKWYK
jgi:hypothetical protein